MRIELNRDDSVVNHMLKMLKKNNGYCPYAFEQNKNTKCICKDFREKVKKGYRGECACGLYISLDD